MRNKFFFFLAAALCCMATNDVWATNIPLDSIPAPRYIKDIKVDMKTYELTFTDEYKVDEKIDRLYRILVYARDENTGFFKVENPDYSYYNYGYWKENCGTLIKKDGVDINLAYNNYYPSYGGVKSSSSLYCMTAKRHSVKDVFDDCISQGYYNIRMVIMPRFMTSSGSFLSEHSYYNPSQFVQHYEGLINYVDIDLEFNMTNEVIAPDEVRFGEYYDVKRILLSGRVTDYQFQKSSNGIKWHTIQSGRLNSAEARKGDTLSLEMSFDEYSSGEAVYYRSIIKDVKSGKSDTSAVQKVQYLYKAVEKGEKSYYLAPGTEIKKDKPNPCYAYKVTSVLPVPQKENGDKIIFTMPACNVEIEYQKATTYTVKFLNADYTLLKTDEVECGEDATAPETPTMEGMTFKQWSRDFTNVHNNLSVIAQYDMGDDYFFYDIMTSHTNNRYKAAGFAGSDKRAMLGDTLTFTAEIRTPVESTLRYQQGLRDKNGNWTWGDPKTIGKFTAAEAEEGEAKTFTLKVAAAYEYFNEIAWRYGEAYRFNLYCAGAVLLSEPYEFDIYYPLTINSKIVESKNIHGDPVYEGLTLENSDGDMDWTDLGRVFPARFGDSVRIYRDNSGSGACMQYARVNRPSSPVDSGEDKDGNAYIVAPGETEQINVTVAQKAVIFDGATPTQQFDFSEQGLGKYNAYYAEVVNCGGSVQNVPDDPTNEGYIFKGWEPWSTDYDSVAYLNIPAISDKFLGFTAKWEEVPTIDTFNVKFFKKDGITQIGETQRVAKGENAVPPAAPKEDGFNFIEWDKPYTTITEDVNITAVYGEEKIWTVTYYDEDGTTKIGEEQVSDGLTAQGIPISKIGYNFLGWFEKNGNPAVFIIKEDISFFAKWEIIEYTVIFQDKDGYDLKTEQVPYGQAATPPDAPEIEGYDFVGWDNDIDHVTEDLTVKPKYEIKKFTVIFLDKDGVQIGETQVVEWDGLASAPEVPEVEGYTFKGWDKEFDHVKSDMTIQAQYQIKTFTVTFVGFEDADLGSQTVNWNEAATAPDEKDIPAVEGYHFTGWDTEFDHVKADLDIKAVYEINKYTVRFFEQDGKTQIGENQTVNWNEAATAPEEKDIPAVEGYHFTGWDTEFDHVKADLDIKAVYEINKYTVTFIDWDEKVLKSESVEHGSAATAPEDPTRADYNFTGWDKKFDNITADLTVQAQYELATVYFTVTYYDWDLTVLGTEKVEEGKDAKGFDPDPTREGYTFTGWSKPLTNITSDLSVQAQYEEIVEVDYTPKNLKAVLTPQENDDVLITLSWDKVDGAASYELRVTANGNELFSQNTMTLNVIASKLSDIEKDYKLIPGTYTINWFVRSTDVMGTAVSDWAQGESFEVTVKDTGTGIEAANSQKPTANSQKLLIDGQLYILRGNDLFSPDGRLVK